MNMQSIKNVLTSKAGRSLLHLQKHSPKILFVVGVVGVATTVVLASRATLKLNETIEEVEKDIFLAKTINQPNYTEQDRKKDLAICYTRLVLKIAKLYAPAALVGLASIGALTGSHMVLSNRNTGLMAAYAALDKAHQRYRARVAEAIGADKARELEYELEDCEYVEETDEGPVVKSGKKVAVGEGAYSFIFDEISSSCFKPSWDYNQMFIHCQQGYANDLLRARGHVFLNDVLDMLGMKRTPAGAVTGWIHGGGGDDYIDFGIFSGSSIEDAMRFVTGNDNAVWMNFNVDGVIYDKI